MRRRGRSDLAEIRRHRSRGVEAEREWRGRVSVFSRSTFSLAFHVMELLWLSIYTRKKKKRARDLEMEKEKTRKEREKEKKCVKRRKNGFRQFK